MLMSQTSGSQTRRSAIDEGRASGEPPIRATRVTKEYVGGKVIALDDVSVEIRENQVTALIGPSGCGKTTLLRLIAGLEYPTRGTVKVYGQPIMGPGPERGMVFQAYTSFPWLNVMKNVEHGMSIQGVPGKERRERAQQALLRGLLRRAPAHQAAAGERGRVRGHLGADHLDRRRGGHGRLPAALKYLWPQGLQHRR